MIVTGRLEVSNILGAFNISGDTNLYDRLTPRETVTVFGRFFGMEEDAITERSGQLFRLLGMEKILDRHCRNLSTGKSIIYSAHDMVEVEHLCDRIILIHEGRALDCGAIPDVVERAGAADLTEAFLKLVEKVAP